MNQFFSFSRFSMLFKKHFAENYKTYLMSAGVMAGLLAVVLGISAYANQGVLQTNMQSSNFIIFMLLGGSVFTSLILADLGNKKEAIAALTLPASSFEKFFVSWLVSFLVFQIVFIIIFYAVVAMVIGFGSSAPGKDSLFINVFSEDRKTVYAFGIYTILHAVMFLGAIYFEKLHFIKTAFAFFISVFLLGLLNRPILSAMFNQQVVGTTIFSPVSIFNGKQAYQIKEPSISTNTEIMVAGLVVLILWISAYYKLKEKEV